MCDNEETLSFWGLVSKIGTINVIVSSAWFCKAKVIPVKIVFFFFFLKALTLYRGNSFRLWSQTFLVQIMTLIRCLALGMLLNIRVPQFPQLYNDVNNGPYLISVVRIKWDNSITSLVQGPRARWTWGAW